LLQTVAASQPRRIRNRGVSCSIAAYQSLAALKEGVVAREDGSPEDAPGYWAARLNRHELERLEPDLARPLMFAIWMEVLGPRSEAVGVQSSAVPNGSAKQKRQDGFLARGRAAWQRSPTGTGPNLAQWGESVARIPASISPQCPPGGAKSRMVAHGRKGSGPRLRDSLEARGRGGPLAKAGYAYSDTARAKLSRVRTPRI